MDAATWARHSALLDEALDLAPPARALWLADLLARDAETGAALTALLQKAEAAEAALTGSGSTPPFQQWAQGAIDEHSSHQPGQRFGVWQLLRPLGRGGMGEVWLAARHDGLYEGQVALKFIRAGLAAETFAARFARERRLLARLNHPGIAKLLDAGIAEHTPYLVLEYVDGAPLLEYVAQHAADLTARLRLLLAAAEAVQHAHGQLVAHRDLKPSNLLVTPDGTLKLLDFGIASVLEGEDAGDHTLTALTGRALTPGYAAPEQIAGEPAGAAADVFALGVLLHELLTSERPFAPQDAKRAAIEHAVLHEPPVPLKTALARSPLTPAQRKAALAFAPVIRKALQREPADRYPSVAALIDDLQRWLDHRPLAGAHTPWPRRTALWLRRNRLLATAALLVFASLGAGMGVALWQRGAALAEAQRNEQMARYFAGLLESGDPSQHQGEWPTVLTLLQDATRQLPATFADDPDTQRALIATLVPVLSKLTRHEEAATLMPHLLALTVALDGEGSVAHGEVLRQFADVEANTRAFESALVHAEKALLLLHGQLPPNDPRLRAAEYQLAIAQGDVDQNEAAEAGYRKAIEDLKREQPQAIGELVSMSDNFAVFYGRLRRDREGLEVLRGVAPLFDRVPPSHIQSALQSSLNMAALQIATGEFGDVEARLVAAKPRVDAVMGPNSNMVGGLHSYLKNYYRHMGRFAEAAEQAAARRAVFAKRLGETSFKVLQSDLDLVELRWLAGAPRAESRRQLIALVPRVRESQGNARGRMDLFEILGDIAQSMDLAELAAAMFREQAALAADAAIRRDDTLAIAGWLTAHPLIQAGRYDEALPRYAALDAYYRQQESSSRGNAGFIASHAYLLALARVPGAVEKLAEARTALPQALPAAHPLLALVAYIAALIDSGGRETADTRKALAALNAAYQRPADEPLTLPLAPLWF